MRILNSIGEALILLLRTFLTMRTAWRDREKIFIQIVEIGNASLPMIAIMTMFIGGVLTLQSGPELAKRGLATALGSIVGIGMVKELGPVMIAIMIAGRIGSAIAAELAAMRVYQEVDALTTMNIDPVRFLVMPRLVAAIITLPILTLFGDVMGWAGGALVAHINRKIDVNWELFFNNLKANVVVGDILHGLYKSLVFAVVVTITCAYIGLRTRGGPREIGRAVTAAVVTSIILILLFDYLITRVLMS